jgi:hypothetical protein
VLSSPELPHHSLDAVRLDDNIEHQVRLCEPVRLVTRAEGGQPVRRTCLGSRSGVRGPDDILWPHPIKFGHELRVRFSDLPMCPAHLQNYTTVSVLCIYRNVQQ